MVFLRTGLLTAVLAAVAGLAQAGTVVENCTMQIREAGHSAEYAATVCSCLDGYLRTHLDAQDYRTFAAAVASDDPRGAVRANFRDRVAEFRAAEKACIAETDGH